MLWMLLWSPVLWRSDLKVFDAVDEDLFHGPTIEIFAAALPSPDLSDYPSATTPLYHLVMAPASWLTHHHIPSLRVLNLLISGLALWVVVRALTAWGSPKLGLLGGLLVGVSPYFVGPAVRLSTDNAALLTVFAALLASHPRTAQSPTRVGVWMTAAVWIRQVHAWLLAPMALASLREPARRKAWLLTGAVAASTLLPIFWLWGGATPPSFAKGHKTSMNIDVLIMSLGILGLYACFFAPWIVRLLRTRTALWQGLGVTLGSVTLLALHSMPWQHDPNKWGGALWSLSARFPELLGVSLVFWTTVPLGALAILAFARHPDRRYGAFLSVVSCAFIAANMLSARAYQKYTEPMLLFLLVSFLCEQPDIGKRAWLLPTLLCLLLAGVSLLRFMF